MLIKVLGPGCAKCKEAENVVNAAVQDAGSAATVEKVTDLKEMMVIDNNVMCTGRVPSKSEVMGWIATPDAHASAHSTSTGCCCGGKC